MHRRAAEQRCGARFFHPRARCARCSPAATCKTRVTSANDGGGGPSHSRTARRAQHRGKGDERPCRRTLGAGPGRAREIVEEVGLLAEQPEPDGRGQERGRVRPRLRASGSTVRRTATRRNASSSFMGSCSTANPSASQSADVSRRRNSSSGRTMLPRRGAMPARPALAVPRNTLSKTVSAWSSAVCATSTAVASCSRRAASSAAYLA